MATIANLDINLGARTDKLDAGLRRGQKAVKGYTSGIKKSTGAMGGWIKGMIAAGLAAITLRAGIQKLRQAFTDLDKIAKSASKIGASAGEIQAFNMQAELTGTSAETAQKGLERFVRMLGDAQNGIPIATKAFTDMGLSVEELAGDDTVTAFGKFMDAVNEAPTIAQRASRGYAVLGRQAMEMTNFINAGSEGIKEAHDDIRRFGGAFTALDTAKIEQFNDQWTRLGFKMKIVFQRIAIEITPALSVMTAQWLEVDNAARGFAGPERISAFAEAINLVNQGLMVTVGFLKSAQATMKFVGASAREAFAELTGDVSGAQFARVQSDLARQMATDARTMIDAVLSGDIDKDFRAKLAQVGKDVAAGGLPEAIAEPIAEGITKAVATKTASTPGSVGAMERGGAQALANKIRSGGVQSALNKQMKNALTVSKAQLGELKAIAGTMAEHSERFEAALREQNRDYGLWGPA